MLNAIKKDDGTIDYKRYYEHIRANQEIIKNTQWADQFLISIEREEPDYDFLDPIHIKSYSLMYNGTVVDISKVGSGYVNQITGNEPLSIAVVFREQSSDEITNFLLNRDDGTPILPNDGTYLLPKDYFFNINAFMLDSNWKPKLLVRGEFLYSGQITKDFTTDGAGMLEIAAEFKPILSSQLKFKD